jgi:hypothetical protein
MWALLMISAISNGFISLKWNLMSSTFFIILKHSLNVNLGEKFLLSNLIGKANMKI